MSERQKGAGITSDDALEKLLSHASPRPVPSAADKAAVREVLHAEWRAVSGRRQARRRTLGFAIAATLVVSVFSLFNLFRAPVAEPVEVATIEKSFGAVYLLHDSSGLQETGTLLDVQSGQTIVTGNAAGIALAWGQGGSMRMDEHTRVRFMDEGSVYLEAGRVYFDSAPSALIGGVTSADSGDFVVATEFGEVSHMGTQFMTEVNDGQLRVSVREGQVAVDGRYHRRVASSGQQVIVSGRQQPTVLSLGAHARDWSWVARTSPPADVDGRSIYEFLQWVNRETGLKPRFAGQSEQVARAELLKGRIDAEPLEALPRWMATTALGFDIDESEGVIYVSDKR